jgi:hypothetical protein
MSLITNSKSPFRNRPKISIEAASSVCIEGIHGPEKSSRSLPIRKKPRRMTGGVGIVKERPAMTVGQVLYTRRRQFFNTAALLIVPVESGNTTFRA